MSVSRLALASKIRRARWIAITIRTTRDPPLDTLAALIDFADGQDRHVKGGHRRPSFGWLFAGGVLEPGETVPWPPLQSSDYTTRLAASQVWRAFIGVALDRVRQVGRTAPVAYGGQVDDHRGRTRCPFWCDSTRAHPRRELSRRRSGGDRRTGRPECGPGSRYWRCARPPQPLGRSTWTRTQRPAAPTGPPSGSAVPWAQPGWRVSYLHTRQREVQAKRRACTGSSVGQAPGHHSTRFPLGSVDLAERVLKDDGHAAFHSDPPRGQALAAHRGQSQGVQAQEDRQIRETEDSLRHVGISLMACAGTLIIQRPRPLLTQRCAH